MPWKECSVVEERLPMSRAAQMLVINELDDSPDPLYRAKFPAFRCPAARRRGHDRAVPGVRHFTQNWLQNL